ncbi:lactonase family protein [Devosia sp. ZB163]|uniref:lactonase family protein n=1 Tax=Devosia sp. ZB163 TaxID=3025938 RepID=UPI00235DEC18|nr:lactonase family protein [Devosia sp. ZB163]MDC9823407.1 lactonase family protein [Devosia sp. ZB163]
MTKLNLLSGSYTGPNGEGLKLLSFDTATGTIELVRSFPGTPDVSWIAFALATRTVYVTDEMAEKAGAFTLAADNTTATPLGYQSTGAKYPCYLRLSPKGTKLAVANYGDDSTPVFSIDTTTGALKPDPTVLRSAHAHDKGHAHWAQWSPEADRLYTADLGHDEVRSVRYEAGSFVGGPETAFSTPKGAGPRHMAFHPNGKFAYLFTEYAETVTALARHADGTLTELNTLPALPADFKGESTGAHIQINAAGTVVYVSNRGHNSITSFAIAADGTISLKQNIACGGNWPRFFLLLDQHLIVANQESEDLVVFNVAADGTLTATGKVFKLQKPVALLQI